MRFISVFEAENWKYAVGEVALIVVGITIALAANSWYEDRQERREEVLVLNQIRQALEIDVEQLEPRFATEKRLEQNILALLEHMDSNLPYTSELEENIRSVRRWVGVRSNTAPYEALKSRGFDLISKDSLRLKLIYYYENQFPIVYETYLNDRDFARERVIPYFLTNLRATGGNTWVPIDYQTLRSDTYFRNLCLSKLASLQVRILPRYEDSLSMIQEILDEIDAEIAH
jgi:hypothetical protein